MTDQSQVRLPASAFQSKELPQDELTIGRGPARIKGHHARNDLQAEAASGHRQGGFPY
jgi:hypothetical protein